MHDISHDTHGRGGGGGMSRCVTLCVLCVLCVSVCACMERAHAHGMHVHGVCVHVSKGQVCIDGKGLLREREGEGA